MTRFEYQVLVNLPLNISRLQNLQTHNILQVSEAIVPLTVRTLCFIWLNCSLQYIYMKFAFCFNYRILLVKMLTTFEVVSVFCQVYISGPANESLVGPYERISIHSFRLMSSQRQCLQKTKKIIIKTININFAHQPENLQT